MKETNFGIEWNNSECCAVARKGCTVNSICTNQLLLTAVTIERNI